MEALRQIRKENNQLENKNKMPETEKLEKEISDLMQKSKEDLEKKRRKIQAINKIRVLDELENQLNAMLEAIVKKCKLKILKH